MIRRESLVLNLMALCFKVVLYGNRMVASLAKAFVAMPFSLVSCLGSFASGSGSAEGWIWDACVCVSPVEDEAPASLYDPE